MTELQGADRMNAENEGWETAEDTANGCSTSANDCPTSMEQAEALRKAKAEKIEEDPAKVAEATSEVVAAAVGGEYEVRVAEPEPPTLRNVMKKGPSPPPPSP